MTTKYFLDGSTILAQQTGSDVLWFLYESDGTRVGFTYNGADYYYTKNAQGDVTGIVDRDYNTVVQYSYDAWGKLLVTTGSMANTIGKINPFLYRGYYYDAETGLYYLNSRYYDPQTGRFLNTDGYVSTATGLLGYNMFAYTNNNPIRMKDSNGSRATECDDGSGRWMYVNSTGKVFQGGKAPKSQSYNVLTGIGAAVPVIGAVTQKGTTHTVKSGGLNDGNIRTWNAGADKYLSKADYIGKSIGDSIKGAEKIDKGCIIGAIAVAGISNYIDYGFSTDFLVGWGFDTLSGLAIGAMSAALVGAFVVGFAVTAPVAGIALATVAVTAGISYLAEPVLDSYKKKLTSIV